MEDGGIVHQGPVMTQFNIISIHENYFHLYKRAIKVLLDEILVFFVYAVGAYQIKSRLSG